MGQAGGGWTRGGGGGEGGGVNDQATNKQQLDNTHIYIHVYIIYQLWSQLSSTLSWDVGAIAPTFSVQPMNG